MIVKSLKLNQFRNYESLQLSFDKGTNLFYGNNAQGKTNILEAVYLCGTTKSHKGSKDREMIRFGEEEAHIRMAISRSQSAYEIDMHLKKNRPKGIAVNGVPIRKAAELLGIANFVFFSPEDLGIIKNGPAERRRFIDMELCQLDKLYLHELSNYNKVIIQRNKLLKECSFNSQYEEMLDIWDMQLVKYGKKLIESRERLVRSVIQFDHGIQDSSLYRLQTVSYIRQCTCCDNAHCIIDIRFFHGLFQIHVMYLIKNIVFQQFFLLLLSIKYPDFLQTEHSPQ